MTTKGPTLMFVLLLAGCGGGQSTGAPTTATVPSSEPSGDSRETAVLRCLRDAPNEPRTDYAYIANYACDDASVPLGGYPTRGAGARTGSVGQGPDGHVVDLYEVPCPSGPVRVYVDAYHCGAGVEVGIDPNNLQPEQLQMVAEQMRALENMPFDPRAVELRRSLVSWLESSPQVHLSVCIAVIEGVVHEGYAFRDLLFSQFVLSMGAAVIDFGDGPEHANRVALASVLGVLRLYQRIVSARGEPAVEPRLRDLARMPQEELEAHVTALAATCEEPRVGMSMSTDGGNVWPPSGPDCDRFVRCCEDGGLVHDGVAVPGTAGLMCLLAAAPPNADCGGGLAMLMEQGISCSP